MRPRPTTPTVLSSSSTPEYLLRFHAPALEGLVGRGDVAGRREEQGHGELGGGRDVGGRCVDDHDAGLRGRLDVDVVEADTGAGDDLELLRGGDRLGVHLRGRADEDRVDVGERREQLVAVGPVDRTDLEVGSQRLDRGGRQLFGDEDDGLAHRGIPSGRGGATRTTGGAGRRRHRDVPSASLGRRSRRITRCNQHVNNGSSAVAVSVAGTSIPYAGRFVAHEPRARRCAGPGGHARVGSCASS